MTEESKDKKPHTHDDESRDVDFRMDFIWEDIQIDDDTSTFSARIVPDSRRYEWITREDGLYLFDKMDNLYFPSSVVNKMLEQMKGMPSNFQPRRIWDINAYLRTRIPVIKAGIEGQTVGVELSDASGEFLASLENSKQGFAIMCVDLVESTKLAHAISQDKYVRLIRTLSNELSEMVFVFRGHVLKYTGDGLIAYFPEPSLITMTDLCLDCSMSMLTLVEKIFNPLCKQNKMPEINIRIGIDSGQASIITLGSSSTKRQVDIIGKVINIAAKIQSIGSPGDVMVGEAARRIAHTMWRVGLREIDVPKHWQYVSESGLPYKVFKIVKGFMPKLAPEELGSEKDV